MSRFSSGADGLSVSAPAGRLRMPGRGSMAAGKGPTRVRFDLADWQTPLASIEQRAATAERLGYEGIQVSELRHDPFIESALAARATGSLRVTTSVAVAFARNPMTVATSANDLQLLSRGRFVLGLGSQVRAHIERRFSMPWTAPAPRMEEFVRAVRAIWHSWETGMPLRFTGEHYRHTLMTPFFDPGPNPFGAPPIWIAGVGSGMTRAAGRVADGFLAHSFTTPRYLETITADALMQGRRDAGDDTPIDVCVQPFVAIVDDDERRAAELAIRRQIAFYASTPAYRGVLELHGWDGIARSLTAASLRKEWDAMASFISDEMVDAFAVVGPPAHVASELVRRYSPIATTISFNTPHPISDDGWADLRAHLDRTP
ncbi:TIGR03617 family F420-dependent LLM class oxidoreductase [Microbacterium sp. No. 7]|uniref:TIGR03617 family F420-dependent LLM class oxidoreductase n=1 Tax=Microbacterium sp. No. 7 TaxID=1714373 RepID=UPI0006ECF08F|nr:TIGR03617 family F420-dependent LLM class oxidoreductase [Microbacterium sp. No. 7]ALJ21689.1 hypothetical protein AOA12_18040 [Microbacterium sp. No. 7]